MPVAKWNSWQLRIGGLFLLWYYGLMIYLAADHRGFQLKEGLKKYLIEKGYEIEDVGAYAYEQGDDYVDFARLAAEKIVQNPTTRRGVFICGSGIGMEIVADKYRGLHAAPAATPEIAKQSREHGNTNVLVLGADYLTPDQAKEIVSAWLATPFSGEARHARRLKKIEEIERQNFK